MNKVTNTNILTKEQKKTIKLLNKLIIKCEAETNLVVKEQLLGEIKLKCEELSASSLPVAN